MDKISYISLQKRFAGKVVALSENSGRVVASGKTTKDLEKTLKDKKINPLKVLFLGPLEKYKQVSTL